MSRLLFAAARGARVQVRVFEFNKWVNSPGMRFGNHDVYRIHPDDERLQYGPISTALREAAVEGRPCAFANVPNVHINVDSAYNLESLPRSLFLLILAEALADEGL